MEYTKGFIRFVVNDNGNGKIKAMNKIRKAYTGQLQIKGEDAVFDNERDLGNYLSTQDKYRIVGTNDIFDTKEKLISYVKTNAMLYAKMEIHNPLRSKKVLVINEKFVKIEPPYIYATGKQIDVDVENTETEMYKPLRHYKYENNTIVKKTDEEIKEVEDKYKKDKTERRKLIADTEKQLANKINILKDRGKPVSERLSALADYIELKK